MHPSLKGLVERLPHARERLGRLFAQDEVFRELCEDCQICRDTSVRMAGAPGKEALQAEYLALALLLEGELMRYLEEHPDS